ncbi:MAG: DUF4157 domain-containing protein [Iphinoe sp. HA4291-MV1]|jgi:hypothetical protein|nr:DUF4157 domain-containing protein [Iphinoe sp. HA4291-MV1]
MERQHLSKTKNAIAQRLQRRIASNNRESTIPRNSTHPIEELQGAIGNRAVNQLLANQPVVQAKPIFRGLSGELRSPTPIQTKLAIGAVGDKYEQEADRVAKHVVNQINTPVPQSSTQSQSIQRQETPEEDDKLQMKPVVQRLASEDGGAIAFGGTRNVIAPDLETSIQQARGSGKPLAYSVREPMERAFRADFSGVRVHVDATSERLNQSIQAKAFTTGQDVFFRQEGYDPKSREGQELIAHELTHVVQQQAANQQQVIQATDKAKRHGGTYTPVNPEQIFLKAYNHVVEILTNNVFLVVKKENPVYKNMNFAQVWKIPKGKQSICSQAEKQLADENTDFLKAVDELLSETPLDPQKISYIYKEYIVNGSTREINLSAETRSDLRQLIG